MRRSALLLGALTGALALTPAGCSSSSTGQASRTPPASASSAAAPSSSSGASSTAGSPLRERFRDDVHDPDDGGVVRPVVRPVAHPVDAPVLDRGSDAQHGPGAVDVPGPRRGPGGVPADDPRAAGRSALHGRHAGHDGERGGARVIRRQHVGLGDPDGAQPRQRVGDPRGEPAAAGGRDDRGDGRCPAGRRGRPGGRQRAGAAGARLLPDAHRADPGRLGRRTR